MLAVPSYFCEISAEVKVVRPSPVDVRVSRLIARQRISAPP
jgi:hypothetical protein